MPKRNTGPRLEWRGERGCFEIVWFERGARRRRSTGTSDGREAEKLFQEFLASRNESGNRQAERLIADVLRHYGEERAPNVADSARIGYAIAALTPFWGEKTVSEVTEQTCREYAAQRSAAPGTVARELATLSAAINYDWKANRLDSPRPVWKPSAPPQKDRWLTREEAAALLRASRTQKARSYLPLFILIGLYTGARKEAILSLRWGQVDLAAGRINFNPPGRAQTAKGRPIVRIPRQLMTFLRLARRRGTATGFVIHRTVADARHPGETRQVRIANIRHGFTAAVDRARLGDVTPHTLRHTAATWLTQSGVILEKVGAQLGHRDPRTTKIYEHHAPDYLDDVVEGYRRPGAVMGQSRAEQKGKQGKVG